MYTVSIFIAMFAALSGDDPPVFTVSADTVPIRISVGAGADALVSPEEGLWSIASGWEQGWPTRWHHAHPQSVEKQGPWTIVRGTMPLDNGTWILSDAYRPEQGTIRCIRRFEWRGDTVLEPCTLSVRFLVSGTGSGVVLPGILYHGNPSGAKSGRTPVYTGKTGEEAYFEEHRFPMPFASFEWTNDSVVHAAALHTLPCPAPCAHRLDQWWSLGLTAHDAATELALLSGPCASNGQRSVIKAVQPGFVAYPDAWLTVPPGTVIEKTFFLDAWTAPREGAGFQQAVRSTLDRYPPGITPDLPSAREIIEGKLRYAETRWLDRGTVAGFRKFPDRDTLVMGWCGQSEALGYALPVLAEYMNLPNATERAQRSLDFLSGRYFEGGFHTRYQPDTGDGKITEPLSQGQAMLCFLPTPFSGARRHGGHAMGGLSAQRACAFHAARILKPDGRRVPRTQLFIAPCVRRRHCLKNPH